MTATRGRPFGRAQKDALWVILRSGPAGVSEADALGLTGSAKKYAGQYHYSLDRAISAHNSGQCPDNCPWPQDERVESGPYGPLDGERMRSDRWSAMAEQARHVDELPPGWRQFQGDVERRWMAAHWPGLDDDSAQELLRAAKGCDDAHLVAKALLATSRTITAGVLEAAIDGGMLRPTEAVKLLDARGGHPDVDTWAVLWQHAGRALLTSSVAELATVCAWPTIPDALKAEIIPKVHAGVGRVGSSTWPYWQDAAKALAANPTVAEGCREELQAKIVTATLLHDAT